MQIKDKRVLVTGASRGIGRGLAVAFAREGARVALVARSEEALQALAEELGGTAYRADLSEPAGADGLIERIEADGPVDVLINNAGVSFVKYMLDNTPEEIEQIFRINVLTPIHLCRQVLPGMLARGGGHIVNVSSLAAVIAPPGLVHYAATKAALSQYTAGLRMDLRGLPIGTTLVQIGSVPTELDDLSRNYGPIREMTQRAKGSDITPLPVVVEAIVDAVKNDKRHVRFPRALSPLSMLVEIPRRLNEWMFRSVSARG
jgi:short-subunit dehydrogenase